jgi:hypothetical protein
MTEPRETHDLDQTLRGWAQRRRTTKEFDGLLKRIVAACAESSVVDGPTESEIPLPPYRVGPSPAKWFALGAASAAIIVAMAYVVFRTPPDPVVPPDLAPQYAWLQEGQLGEKIALVREMKQMFENRLQWIAETDGRVVLEVQQDDRGRTASPPENANVVVRVVVVRRGPDSSRWTPVWAVDVVARQEQVVSLTPASAGLPPGTELSLWAFAVDADAVAVDTRLSLVEHSLAVETSDVQRPGIPVSVHEVRKHGQQYRVFQTVAMLDNEV